MNPYWSSRQFFDCKPDCPERKPGCHDHCERYQKKRAQLDAWNAAERKRKEAAVPTIDTLVKKKDSQAKLRRNIPGYK